MPWPKTETIRARIEPELNAMPKHCSRSSGCRISTEAIRLFYKQATLQRGLPFAVRLPNAETREALSRLRNTSDLIEYENLEDLKAAHR